ncbi:MAG: hypothetical protein HOV86_20400 [Thermoactinospora sp.]|nr:hypothetical protein [Thermoactinospora sp.]
MVRPSPCPRAGDVKSTPILDWTHPRILALSAEVSGADERAFLVAAHRLIADRVRPVYAMNEAQPASTTLALGRGSCSQRLALLEAVARSRGIDTRTRGLLVDPRFWRARFPRLHVFFPRHVVLAWPEFLVGGVWVSVSELHGPSRTAEPFTNTGEETLFEAVARGCDLSGHVLADLGHFDSRDDLFARHGQTLCLPVRVAADLLSAPRRRRRGGGGGPTRRGCRLPRRLGRW